MVVTVCLVVLFSRCCFGRLPAGLFLVRFLKLAFFNPNRTFWVWMFCMLDVNDSFTGLKHSQILSFVVICWIGSLLDLWYRRPFWNQIWRCSLIILVSLKNSIVPEFYNSTNGTKPQRQAASKHGSITNDRYVPGSICSVPSAYKYCFSL